MPSLREIAMRTSPGQRALGTEGGTSLEQVEQARSLFHLVREHDSGLEQGFSQKSANDWPCSSVPFPRARNNGTSLPDDLVAGVARLKKDAHPSTPDARCVADRCQRRIVLGRKRMGREGTGYDTHVVSHRFVRSNGRP